MDQQQLWVEPVGGIIMARLRGVAHEAMMRECQQRVLTLVRDTGQHKVLYDGLEMEATVDLAIMQQEMDAEIGDIKLRRAILVPNTRIAYLARIAFGEGEYRVFYNDIGAALAWLAEVPTAI